MSDAAEVQAQQQAYWNGPGATRWVEQQQEMDAGLRPVAVAAIEHAAPRPGEVVIDVGCGTGDTSLELARAVLPGGRVIGLDISEPMLGLARTRGAGVRNIEWILGDAGAHGFAPETADLLFSRFGVMFFGDPTASFTNLRRALKPGGRVAFACWRAFDENPWMKVPLKAVAPLVPPLERPGPEEPGPFAFAETERVTRILNGAGFSAPSFHKFDFAMRLGAGLDDAVRQAMTIGAAARALQEQPDEVKAKAAAAIREALEPHLKGDAVRLPAAVWLVSAVSG
jgi:SAM-dependent methyltransferase